MSDDRLYEDLDIEQIKKNLALQKKLQEQRAKEEEILNTIKGNRNPKLINSLKSGEIPPLPRYGGRPRGMDKTPEQLRMEALQHMQDRAESEAIGEEKRRQQEEFESGYKKMN